MKVSEIKLIQQSLAEANLYTDKIDGKQGKNTNHGIELALAASAAQLPADWQQWSTKRKTIAYLQLICQQKHIDSGAIDGFYGPQTEYAVDRLRVLQTIGAIPRSFADIIPLRLNPHDFPLEADDSLRDYYGEPCKAQLVQVHCPWVLRLDWNLSQTTSSISIHPQVSDSLATVLENVYQAYGDDGIKQHGLDRYGGSYNCRNKRGSQSSWSTHAWGIAIDWFPSKNKLKWDSDRASLAHPDLDTWWECWEQQGWLSLGRTENRDWMHVQAAKR